MRETILRRDDPPIPEELPFSGRQFIKKRHAKFAVNGVEQSAVLSVKFLIATASRPGVEDRVRRFAMHIWIARIDPPKIRQQRDKTAIALVNPVAHLVDTGDLVPCKYKANLVLCEMRSVHRVCSDYIRTMLENWDSAGVPTHRKPFQAVSFLFCYDVRMLVRIIGKTWKLMPRGMRTWLARRFHTKFTVSAGGIITNERGEVLLLDHVLRPGSGWGVPGGFVARGEQPDVAFRREVMEETGLELSNVRIYRTRTFRRHIEIIFLADGIGEARVGSREIKQLGWFAVDDIPKEMGLDIQFMIHRALKADDQ